MKGWFPLKSIQKILIIASRIYLRALEKYILHLSNIISSDFNFQPMHIEAVLEGRMALTRPILAKFLYRPERFPIIEKKRDVKNKVRVSKDLIWEDRGEKEATEDRHEGGIRSWKQT